MWMFSPPSVENVEGQYGRHMLYDSPRSLCTRDWRCLSPPFVKFPYPHRVHLGVRPIRRYDPEVQRDLRFRHNHDSFVEFGHPVSQHVFRGLSSP